jgi:DUF4097 and DUF4098 domain-containing protein YvlB
MIKTRNIAVALLTFALSASAWAANVTSTEKFVKEFSLDIGGEFFLENPVGNVEIVGTEQPGLYVTAVKTVTGTDPAALKDARDQTQLAIGGDQRSRVIRTLLPPVRRNWSSNVSYSIRVPRTVHVRVAAHSGERIRIVNIAGNVTIKNVNGEIRLESVTGPTVVDSVNGNILYEYGPKPMANAQLSTLNGLVQVIVPADSNFEWDADSIRGDFFTSLPVRGRVNGTSFHASVNAPGGPTLSTSSVLGNVVLLKRGTSLSDARSIRAQAANADGQDRVAETMVMTQPRTPVLDLGVVDGNWIYDTTLGDIRVREVRGSARVVTGAGSVQIGTIQGQATVSSLGGPLDLGDVFGPLLARTGAGNVIVRAAREGGFVSTEGGIIRVVYAGGATTLRSGGGDIIVRQASGTVNADTRSGDINISLDPNVRSQKIAAKTTMGNVTLNVTARFGADVDATIVTSDADKNSIQSDFGGLTVKREQFGTKTRIRATGKINGGGERVELYAEEGSIHITQQTANPITLLPPGR